MGKNKLNPILFRIMRLIYEQRTHRPELYTINLKSPSTVYDLLQRATVKDHAAIANAFGPALEDIKKHATNHKGSGPGRLTEEEFLGGIREIFKLRLGKHGVDKELLNSEIAKNEPQAKRFFHSVVNKDGTLHIDEAVKDYRQRHGVESSSSSRKHSEAQSSPSRKPHELPQAKTARVVETPPH